MKQELRLEAKPQLPELRLAEGDVRLGAKVGKLMTPGPLSPSALRIVERIKERIDMAWIGYEEYGFDEGRHKRARVAYELSRKAVRMTEGPDDIQYRFETVMEQITEQVEIVSNTGVLVPGILEETLAHIKAAARVSSEIYGSASTPKGNRTSDAFK